MIKYVRKYQQRSVYLFIPLIQLAHRQFAASDCGPIMTGLQEGNQIQVRIRYDCCQIILQMVRAHVHRYLCSLNLSGQEGLIMAITTVNSFDGRVKSHIDLRTLGRNVSKIAQGDDYKKNWDEMTTVQRLFHILTLGLWRPGLESTEKTEIHNKIHNIVTSLLIELSNHEPELQEGGAVKLHLPGGFVNCVLQGGEYHLDDEDDTSNRYSLPRDEVDRIRQVTQFFTCIDCYETDRKIPLPFLEKDKSNPEIGMAAIYQAIKEIALVDFDGLLPGYKLQDERLRGGVALTARDLTSVLGDIDRDFGSTATQLKISGIDVPAKVIMELLCNFGWVTGIDGAQMVVPEKIPTTISRDLAEKVLNDVSLNDGDREKVISTLSAPGAFEMILTTVCQGVIAEPYTALANVVDTYWWNSGAESIWPTKATEQGYPLTWDKMRLLSIENHDGVCRAYTRQVEIVPMTIDNRMYPCCAVSQFELGPREGAVKQTVSTVAGDEEFLGIGLQLRDCSYALLKTPGEYEKK